MYVERILSKSTKEYLHTSASLQWEFVAFLCFYIIVFHHCGFVWTKQDISPLFANFIFWHLIDQTIHELTARTISWESDEKSCGPTDTFAICVILIKATGLIKVQIFNMSFVTCFTFSLYKMD